MPTKVGSSGVSTRIELTWASRDDNPPSAMPIRAALLSVSDKTGLAELAAALSDLKVRLLSTGGTQRFLAEAGVRVEGIESYTGSPEVMAGRVKTLHPKVHGGILAREGRDEADLERLGASFIDVVVVNLYPFEKTLELSSASFEDLIENIDIGGPCMLRAAAKNHERVSVVCDPADYPSLVSHLRADRQVPHDLRRHLAAKAFSHTAQYDAAISRWLSTSVLPA